MITELLVFWFCDQQQRSFVRQLPQVRDGTAIVVGGTVSNNARGLVHVYFTAIHVSILSIN
jgi:hypothetical protein